jgi:hypothetical protein
MEANMLNGMQVTNEVLLSLAAAGVAMLLVPFRYLVGLFLVDQFTNELKFREKSVKEFYGYIADWWNSIPVAPVIVLPHEKPEHTSDGKDGKDGKSDGDQATRGEAVMQAMSEWLGEENDFIQLPGGAN